MADQKCLGNLKRKDVKYLMAMIRKELKSTETTVIRKAIKKGTGKGPKCPQIGCNNFFLK
jgi:hypothetical protein